MLQLTVFRGFFMILLEIQKEIFFYPPVNANEQNLVSFLVSVGAAALFTAKISSCR